MKKCSKCKTEKELSEFGVARSRKDGLNYWCKGCCKTYSQENDTCKALRSRLRNDRVMAENIEKLLLYFIDHPCVKCGETDPVVLEFNHIDPSTKKKNVSQLMRYNWSTIQKEIDKCECVCANCHKRITAKQQGWAKQILSD
jgi:hypothetical protein